MDQALVRDGLRKLLEERGHEIVAEAVDGPDAVELARRHRPDVALLDLDVSNTEILTATRDISAQPNATAVVLLGNLLQNTLLPEAIGCGARGFLTRDLDGPAFCSMLERAAAGELAITPAALGSLVEEIIRGVGREGRGRPSMALTPREQEVMEQMAWGRTSNRELAESMGLSENTVRFHVRNILRKLDRHSRAAAVAYALTHGIVVGREEV